MPAIPDDHPPAVDRTESRAADVIRGHQLEYFTIGWNIVDATVAVGAGLAAGSIALIGFGTDRMDSRALVADSRQTSLCAYLSAILLGGLALKALSGWWADPAAAFVMAPIIAREGREALRGESCSDGGAEFHYVISFAAFH